MRVFGSATARRAAAAATLLAIVFAAPVAASDRCDRLSAELSRLGASPKQARTYAAAADKQRAAVDAARAQARRGGCTGFALMRPAACAAYLDKLARMEANLASLDAMAKGGGLTARRRAIKAEMAASGCLKGSASSPAESTERPTAANRSPIARGSYRTLCVRLCDGYYYPISWSATRKAFASEEAICRAQCPRAEVSLYVHPTGTESDAAVSLDGRPYAELPNAFRYRRELDPGCGCGKRLSAMLDLRPTLKGALTEAALPSLADLKAGQEPTLVSEADLPDVGAPPEDGSGQVRRVGPESLYVR